MSDHGNKKLLTGAILLCSILVLLVLLTFSRSRKDYADKVLDAPPNAEIDSRTLLHLAEQLSSDSSIRVDAVTDGEFFQLCDKSFDRLKYKDTGLFETMLNYCMYANAPHRADYFISKSLEYIDAGSPKADHVLAELDARLYPVDVNDLDLERLFGTVADERLLIALYMSLSDVQGIDRDYLHGLLTRRNDVRDHIKDRFSDWANQ